MRFLFVLFFLCLVVKSFTQNSVGDVRYSVLPPEIFTKLNGDWIEMDGGSTRLTDSLFKRSLLHTKYKLEKLPDARGVFLRAMNSKRENGGDTEGDRSVGSYQADTFTSHSHPINQGIVGWGNLGNGDPWRITSDDGPSWNNTNIELSAQPVGGAETRPRNICLYVYIKIN